ALVCAPGESALGRPVTAGGVFFCVMRRYFPLLCYWGLFLFSLYVALALCILPVILWIWIFVSWIAVTPAMFVENIGLGAAMGRSWRVVEGRWWRTFLILFLMVILWWVVQIALGAFLQLGQLHLQRFVWPFLAAAISPATD